MFYSARTVTRADVTVSHQCIHSFLINNTSVREIYTTNIDRHTDSRVKTVNECIYGQMGVCVIWKNIINTFSLLSVGPLYESTACFPF